MTNFKQLFLETLKQELESTSAYNVTLKIHLARARSANAIYNPKGFTLPADLISLYQTCGDLTFLWHLADNDENTEPFRTNEYLTKTYYDNDYSWSFVSETMLSGYINITSATDIFKPKFCKDQGYYYRLSANPKLGNKDDFFPFDITSHGTACLKKEGNEILDNIWFVDVDAEAVYNMNIGIADYLNLAYEAKCLAEWQATYVFQKKCQSYEIMKQILPQIMPNLSLNLNKFGI
jgi:hypothetical protein